ncbi:MAG TPA: hypothetical protein VJI46_01205 [Candidatus Nanoarchaeia archaeon]|nr:hypothetical protein [Candidatus Nanoarchaeia archaeon]
MDLGEFLSRAKVPHYSQLRNGPAEGVVHLSYSVAGVPTDLHTEYIAFLAIMAIHPGKTFDELHDIAINEYGFDDPYPGPYEYLGVLEQFIQMGAVKAKGETARTSVLSLDEQGLKKIEVLGIEPKYKQRREEFRQYFPCP